MALTMRSNVRIVGDGELKRDGVNAMPEVPLHRLGQTPVEKPEFLTSAIFLDKDGTLLRDVPYNVRPQDMVFAPGVQEGLALLAQLRRPVIVITNQPGIALGKFDFDGLHKMRQHLSRMLEDAGVVLTGFYFCPHHPEGSRTAYARLCNCRKPQPGLLLTAARQHYIDLSQSWFVGDILHDIEAGRRAGCRTVLIDNGNETEWLFNEWRNPDRRMSDFFAASQFLVDQFKSDEQVSR